VQSEAAGASRVAGWYGKMPCLGDFAGRRLAAEFTDPWDTWLQRSIAESRQQMGNAWLDAFLTSPMWRFALAPGLCGGDPYIGLLVPSVDKVGRYFPLTFALALDARDSLTRAMRAESWFAGLESVALAALSADFSIDALERLLSEHLFRSAIAEKPAGAQDLTACWRDPATPQLFHFSSVEMLPAAIEAAAYRMLEQAAAGLSFWWCVAPQTGASELHVSVGLPPADHFHTLLRGRSGVAETPPPNAPASTPEPLPTGGSDPMSLEALTLDPARGDPLADTLPLDPLKAFESSSTR
jgi:type VI secretion system protein ImpM